MRYARVCAVAHTACHLLQALRNNPFAPAVPCHRVVAQSRKIGGFTGSKDPNGPQIARKVALLKAEGVTFDAQGWVTQDCMVTTFADL
jgi:methylated-DNA-[protein]-cysteine S-methyltransferase